MRKIGCILMLAAAVALVVLVVRQQWAPATGSPSASSTPAPRVEAPRPTATPTPIPVRTVSGLVVDIYTGAPVVSATVSMGEQQVSTDEQGRYELAEVPADTPLTAQAPEYDPATATPAVEPTVDFKLRPRFLLGRVVDSSTGAPLPGARLYLGSVMTHTDASGQFRLVDVPTNPTVTVRMAGYAVTTVQPGQTISREIHLKPFAVKAAYLTYFSVSWTEQLEVVLDLVDRTELNALVIDVKGDRGWIVYDSEVPLAQQIGAVKPVTKDFDKFMARLKERNIYTIARIVVFKDDVLSRQRPDLAVKVESGKPYVDWEDLQWVDPFQTEVWEYNMALAEEAARRGFDEIQFDYVRFPSEGIGGTVFARENTQVNRLDAIRGFVSAASAQLQPLGVFTAVDLFGWTMLREDDLGIGQLIDDVAPHVDYICPMVYPSTWEPGSAGVAEPAAQPYEIVLASVKAGVERMLYVPTVKVRPWLQDFYDYGPLKLKYGAREVRLQKKASADAGAPGWMLWDPQTKYTADALDPE